MARHHSKTKNPNAYLDQLATRREVLTAVTSLLAKHEDQHHRAPFKGKTAFGKPGAIMRSLGRLLKRQENSL